jgi:hypothetical protein
MAQTRPFAPGEVQPHLENNDSPTQNEVVHSITDRRNNAPDYDQLPRSNYTLDNMRQMVEKNDRRGAERMLRRRGVINFNREPKYVRNRQDPDLVWNARTHYLDHLCLVPTQPGLDVILPIAGTQGWEWKLDLRRRQKQFSGDRSHLGFEPWNRMLWAGTCQDMHVWLALVPRADALFGDDHYSNNNRQYKTTNIDTQLYNIVVMFLAKLCKDISVAHIDRIEPDQWPEVGTKLSIWTNILCV